MTRCTATNRQGNRCGRHTAPGATVCHYHGGAAPQVANRAAERVQLAELAAEFGITAAQLAEAEADATWIDQLEAREAALNDRLVAALEAHEAEWPRVCDDLLAADARIRDALAVAALDPWPVDAPPDPMDPEVDRADR